MSQPDDLARMSHMLRHARLAREFVAGRELQDLERDLMLQLALTRAIEIIGEAANRVSPWGRFLCPAIPWTHVVGMRHRLAHGYDSVDLERRNYFTSAFCRNRV